MLLGERCGGLGLCWSPWEVKAGSWVLSCMLCKSPEWDFVSLAQRDMVLARAVAGESSVPLGRVSAA